MSTDTQTETPDGAAILKKMEDAMDPVIVSYLGLTHYSLTYESVNSLVAHVKALEAENAELRKALEKIATRTQSFGLLWWQETARAALNTEGE